MQIPRFAQRLCAFWSNQAMLRAAQQIPTQHRPAGSVGIHFAPPSEFGAITRTEAIPCALDTDLTAPHASGILPPRQIESFQDWTFPMLTRAVAVWLRLSVLCPIKPQAAKNSPLSTRGQNFQRRRNKSGRLVFKPCV